jgi:hypothetical protein
VTKGKKVLWLWRQAISEKDDHEDDEAEAEAEHEGDKLAAEEKSPKKCRSDISSNLRQVRLHPTHLNVGSLDLFKCWFT